MTTLPPSRAKVIAISLPIPLAAPVMTATLSFKRMGRSYRILVRKVVEHHLAEAKRQVGDKMAGGNHPAHRQAGDVAHRMLEKLDRRGPGPRAFQGDPLQIITHELADPGRAIHMWDDLDHETGLCQAFQQRRRVKL